MPVDRPTRRRVLTILAATAAGAVTGSDPAKSAKADFTWRGVAMGADATILFSGVDPDAARQAAAQVEAEIDRLEQALSLYRPDSELCRLNRQGTLAAPSADLRRALDLALRVSDASEGLFDPTVQPLWEAYVDWFTATPDAGLPPDSVLAGARASIGWQRVRIAANAIRLGKGQRLTLNGLGQGFFTDRVAELLSAQGLTNVLVDLGEQRALGPQRDGFPWRIAQAGAAPFRLTRGALATSEGAGCVLGADGAAHHLFDPRTARSASHWKRLTVHHRSAAVADALSTGLSIASADEIAALLPRFAGTVVWAHDLNDRERQWTSPSADPAAVTQGA